MIIVGIITIIVGVGVWALFAYLDRIQEADRADREKEDARNE